MCRNGLFIICLIVGLCVGSAGAVPIEVENFSFELPGTGKPSFDQSGTVPGWTKVELATQAGAETGWTPTDGVYTAYMGNEAVIYNLTDFLALEGDTFQLMVDARSTWQGNILRAELFYEDNGNRVIFATTDIDLSPGDPPVQNNTMATYVLDSNAVGPEASDHKVGIQFSHIDVGKFDANIWLGFDNVRLELTTSLLRAQMSVPVHESSIQETQVALDWVAGPDAEGVTGYQVYLSDDWDAVNDGTAEADKGQTTDPGMVVDGLVKGVTYFWRVDTLIGAETYRGNIWTFTVVPTTAYSPNPVNGEGFAPVDAVLSWLSGSGAVEGHIVIFGDDFDEVNDTPVGVGQQLDVADTNWAPSELGPALLDISKSYFWRVDEIEALPNTIHKGQVWSFTTVPIKGLGTIEREVWENINGTTVDALTGDPNFPDNPDDIEVLSRFEIAPIGILNYGSRTHGWLYVRNAGDYTFWISSGENSQLWLGDHPSTADMIAFVDAEEGRDGWTDPREFDKYPEIQQSVPIHLNGGGSVYYIQVLHKKGTSFENLAVAWSGPDSNDVQQVIPGTSLIPFYEIALVSASGPNPAHTSVDVREDPVLAWLAGDHAVSHQIYLGTDPDMVLNADSSTAGIYQGIQDATSYVPGALIWGTTYYWRIDEVNDAHPDSPWKGKVWEFTTGSFKLVDDFEDYTDNRPNRIFETWRDMFAYTDALGNVVEQGNGTTMIVGADEAPYGPERAIINNGRQSLPLTFDNSAEPMFAETDRTFESSQDWTTGSGHPLNVLGLAYRGRPASAGSLDYDATTGQYTIVGTGTDIWNESDQFHYAYLPLNGDGSITAKVESIEETNEWAKAGVMIRQGLDADAVNIYAAVAPSGRVTFQIREFQGDVTTSQETGADSITLPYWVRLTRAGSILTGEMSVDGQTWEQIMGLSSFSVFLAGDVKIGLAVTSHAGPYIPCTAVFSNVSVQGAGGTSFTTVTDIGLPVNDADPLYVRLESVGGASAEVTHSDADAILTNAWNEWRIPLTEFSNQGVDLTRIQKMIIGIGGDGGPQYGRGKLYIDDVRLYEE